jgi:hypothetical protein
MGFEKQKSLSQYLYFERQLTWPFRYHMEMHIGKATVKTWNVLSQGVLWVRITESENMDKINTQDRDLGLSKVGWDCSCYGGGRRRM